MTASRGVRAIQRLREDLFSAELKLRAVRLCLLDAIARAERYGADDDALGYIAAFGLVQSRYVDVLKETRSLA
jgi:hypothetical protein